MRRQSRPPKQGISLGVWKCFVLILIQRAYRGNGSCGELFCNKSQHNVILICWVTSVFISVTLEVYFIPSSEFNAYLKQIKVVLSAVKQYRIFSLVTNTIYIFSL